MGKLNLDLYSGFEGEPEYVITHRDPNGRQRTIRAWGGHFDAIVMRFEPGPAGWMGIALHVHLLTGWHDREEWTDPNPTDTLRQLELVDRGVLDEAAGELLRWWCDFLRATVRGGGAVSIREG